MLGGFVLSVSESDTSPGSLLVSAMGQGPASR